MNEETRSLLVQATLWSLWFTAIVMSAILAFHLPSPWCYISGALCIFLTMLMLSYMSLAGDKEKQRKMKVVEVEGD